MRRPARHRQASAFHMPPMAQTLPSARHNFAKRVAQPCQEHGTTWQNIPQRFKGLYKQTRKGDIHDPSLIAWITGIQDITHPPGKALSRAPEAPCHRLGQAIEKSPQDAKDHPQPHTRIHQPATHASQRGKQGLLVRGIASPKDHFLIHPILSFYFHLTETAPETARTRLQTDAAC